MGSLNGVEKSTNSVQQALSAFETTNGYAKLNLSNALSEENSTAVWEDILTNSKDYKLTKVKTLNLSNNVLSVEAAYNVLEFLKQCPNIETLDLQNTSCSCPDDLIVQVINYLKANTSLKTIMLPKGMYNDRFLKMLYNVVKVNNTITDLQLEGATEDSLWGKMQSLLECNRSKNFEAKRTLIEKHAANNSYAQTLLCISYGTTIVLDVMAMRDIPKFTWFIPQNTGWLFGGMVCSVLFSGRVLGATEPDIGIGSAIAAYCSTTLICHLAQIEDIRIKVVMMPLIGIVSCLISNAISGSRSVSE